MKNETLKIYVDGVLSVIITDPCEIYKRLSHELIAKKIHKCAYIKKISDKCNYDGTRNITVFHDNGVKDVYTIEF